MLIALFDYVKYRLQRGRYSAQAIDAGGGRLASARNFPPDKLPTPGHVIVVHTRRSFVSWLVMYFTNSLWSHTAMAVDNGNVVEVTLEGTIEHPFTDLLNDEDYLVIGGPPMTAQQQRDVVDAAHSHVSVVKFSYRVAAIIGIRLLGGRDPNYHPRLSIDLLTLVVALCWLGRRHKCVVIDCAVLGILYVAYVLSGKRHRREMRAKRTQGAPNLPSVSSS